MVVRCTPLSYQKLTRLHSECREDARELTLTEFHQLIDRYTKQGPVIQIEANDIAIAVAGIVTVRRTTGHLWMIASDRVNDHKLSFVKLIRKAIDVATKDYVRVQCDVRCDKPNYVKMIKLCGFQEEGILRKFNTDGTDSVILAKVR